MFLSPKTRGSGNFGELRCDGFRGNIMTQYGGYRGTYWELRRKEVTGNK